MSDPPIKINRTLYGVLLATLASVFWGSMGVCVQYIFENTNTQPQALSSFRLLLSGTVLVILNLFLSRRPLLAVLSSLKGTAGIALSGLELLGAHLTFFIAIYYSNAGTAAIFLATTPLLAGIYLFLRGKKRFTAKEGLCCALAFFGVLLNSVQRGLLNFPIQLDGGFLGHDFRRFCINLFHSAQTFN